jgi:hypothetical protein
VRLTRQQYENSLRDLTGLDVRPARDLPEDPVFAGFNRGLELEVGELVSRIYRDQAESIARQTVANAAALQRVLGCDPKTGDACASTFITEFGKKAWRRPLTDAEKAKYLALFKKGDTIVEAGDPFTKGVQVTLEAFFQSPKFLYRIETSTRRDGALIPLTSHEIAARLSYMLANTTPDAALLQAADRNELLNPENVAAHARRILGSPTGRATIRDFHRQWLDVDAWDNHLDKDPKLYPTVKPSLAPTLIREMEMFVEEVTYTRKKGLASLLTAPFTFVNNVTAPLYGVRGTFTAELKPAELDPAQRAGIVTQIGFLASHALSNQSSPIHRGVFVQRRLLCTTIPDPSEQVPALPPPSANRTTREVVSEHTAAEGCRGCHHGLINPVGFGLENFDAVGQWRTTDNGKPVDASGSLVGTEKNLAFRTGVELARAVVESPESRACYARQWWRYAFGRQETDADSCALGALAEGLGNDAHTATDLLADMTRTKAFMFRSPEEN